MIYSTILLSYDINTSYIHSNGGKPMPRIDKLLITYPTSEGCMSITGLTANQYQVLLCLRSECMPCYYLTDKSNDQAPMSRSALLAVKTHARSPRMLANLLGRAQ